MSVCVVLGDVNSAMSLMQRQVYCQVECICNPNQTHALSVLVLFWFCLVLLSFWVYELLVQRHISLSVISHSPNLSRPHVEDEVNSAGKATKPQSTILKPYTLSKTLNMSRLCTHLA